MEIKSVYLDLQEGVKKGNVWRLESEAFKDPIEIKICYDNTELKDVYREIANLKSDVELHDKQITRIQGEQVNNNLFREEYENKVYNKQTQLNELRETIGKKSEEIESLYKVIADQKTTIETLSGTILHLQEQVKLLEKKTTKQPTVIHDKCFISGHESVGLGVMELYDGDYLMIAKYEIGEHNEYVTNKNELIMEKIHVENHCYVPFYKLEGGTELDVPTATIYYDLVFMPI